MFSVIRIVAADKCSIVCAHAQSFAHIHNVLYNHYVCFHMCDSIHIHKYMTESLQIHTYILQCNLFDEKWFQ